MPKLNLNEDLIYDNDKMISDCDLPFHESIRTRSQRNSGWRGRYGNGPRVESASIWKFRDRIIKNNIGKSFDKAFSYYLRKTKHIYNSHYWWMNSFQSSRMDFQDYIIDENGNIQEGEWTISCRNRMCKRSSNLRTFDSADLVVGYMRKSDGKVFTKSEYAFKIYSEGVTNNHFQPVALEGYQVKNVQPNSKQEIRLKYEYRQKKKQLDKERVKERKEKEYSFLTRDEEKIKKEKAVDLNKLYSHGFDDESFKGYHGRKNK